MFMHVFLGEEICASVTRNLSHRNGNTQSVWILHSIVLILNVDKQTAAERHGIERENDEIHQPKYLKMP